MFKQANSFEEFNSRYELAVTITILQGNGQEGYIQISKKEIA